MIDIAAPPSSAVDAETHAEALRTTGHDLIDRMADYLAAIERRPVSPLQSPREIAARFAEPLPAEGRPADEVWEDVWTLVAEDAIHVAHPMFMGHQVAPPLPHAVLADALASLLNQSVAVREMSPTGTFVEGQVVRWLAGVLGYPATSDGTFVSGGSVANLTALLAAREARFPGCWAAGVARTPDADRMVLVASPHAHYCIERTAGILGFGSDAVIPVPERNGRMDAGALEDTLRELRREGRIPLAIAATAASTATGLFDPLEEIAEIAEREGVWLHVDGAHGASLLLSDALRDRVRGIERADSVAWDPHKMMFMPISLGAVFGRDRRHLDAAFQQSAPYLFHLRPGETRSGDLGWRTLQCSRRLDALKLWVCLRHYGARYFAELIETTVRNAESLHRKLTAAPDFEPMHVPESNILCFRHLPPRVRERDVTAIDAFQAELRERYNASGEGWITSTVLNGQRVLRVTLMNPQTTDEHLDRLLAGLRTSGDGMRQPG